MPVADVAERVVEVDEILLAHAVGGRLLVPSLERRDDAVELDAPAPVAFRAFFAPGNADLLALDPVEHLLALLYGELAEGHVEIDARRLRHRLDDAERPTFATLHRVAPRRDRACADRHRLVGHDEIGI